MKITTRTKCRDAPIPRIEEDSGCTGVSGLVKKPGSRCDKRESWLRVMVRVLVKWVGSSRAQRRPRWYDSDGAHRGL
jgi:hypothetical protein